MPWEWQKKLFMIANSYGLIAFSSAFDESSADFLKSINNPIFKISSFENTDLELIKYISKIKKPIILSAGLANISELNDAVKILKKNARNNFALLKCTSSYPADNVDLNIKTIQDMKKKFKCPVGFSDHTKDIYASIAAVSIGAEIIEKHVKLDDEKSIDSQFAIDTSDLKKLVDGCNKAYLSIGKKF